MGLRRADVTDPHRMLLVEGSDDKHVIRCICAKLCVQCPTSIKPHGGVTNLLPAITLELQAGVGQNQIIGVIVDANANLAERWQAVGDRFRAAGYHFPASPTPTGTIIPSRIGSPLPRAGVWVWPNNKDCGELEDFLKSLVPPEDQLLPFAKRVVKCLPEKRFTCSDQSKAVIHTWLAWQSNPGRPYGTAITAGFLDPRAGVASSLVKWMQCLFYPA